MPLSFRINFNPLLHQPHRIARAKNIGCNLKTRSCSSTCTKMHIQCQHLRSASSTVQGRTMFRVLHQTLAIQPYSSASATVNASKHRGCTRLSYS